jgi:hypothetical protein
MPEKPPTLQGTDRVALGCRVVSLMLFSGTEGHAWALVIPFGPYCGLFDFEETIRWVSASAPAGCSPKALEG